LLTLQNHHEAKPGTKAQDILGVCAKGRLYLVIYRGKLFMELKPEPWGDLMAQVTQLHPGM
jgi:hypothetical protein